MRTARSIAVVVVLVLALAGVVSARAAERESGIQRSPDRKRTLISKGVAGQRYAITLNTEDRSLTGNALFAGACTSEGRESGIQTVPGGTPGS